MKNITRLNEIQRRIYSNQRLGNADGIDGKKPTKSIEHETVVVFEDKKKKEKTVEKILPTQTSRVAR